MAKNRETNTRNIPVFNYLIAMIIAIDGNEANVKNRVGSNEYAFQILRGIWQCQKPGSDLEFRIYLKNPPLPDLPKPTSWWQYQVLKPKFLWTQWRLPLELFLKQNQIDLFFTPGHYAPRFCPIPLVIAIMDLAFLRFPQQFRKKDLYTLVNWTKRSVKQASHIFTISQFSKKEIEHFYNFPGEKITVTYPGLKKIQSLTQNLKILEKYRIEKNKYFLHIGTLQPRKNLVRLIKAFGAINTKYQIPNTKLLIVGKKGWLYEEIFNKVRQLKLEEQIVFTGYVGEEEKAILLKNALALVLPSLYEGFGIPVLEAMQIGCPVIVSRNSSLSEVVGETGLYIDDPLSVSCIKKVLLKMVKLDQNQRQRLINSGLKQAKKFSWLKAGKKTLDVLKEVVHVCH